MPGFAEGFVERGKFVQDEKDGEIIFTDRVPWLYGRWLIKSSKSSWNPSFLVLQYMSMILAIHCWHVDIEFARENRGNHVADFDAW